MLQNKSNICYIYRKILFLGLGSISRNSISHQIEPSRLAGQFTYPEIDYIWVVFPPILIYQIFLLDSLRTTFSLRMPLLAKAFSTLKMAHSNSIFDYIVSLSVGQIPQARPRPVRKLIFENKLVHFIVISWIY